MKTNKFLIAAAAVTMLFASCSKEQGNDNGGSELTGPTYATFTFKDGGTKVGETSDSDNGHAETDAKTIGDVRLLIFNATSGALEVNDHVATIVDNKISKLVTPGQKKMYVIANVSQNATMHAALGGLAVGIATLTDFLALTYTATGEPGQRPSIVYSAVSHAPSTDFTITPLATKTATAGFPMSSTDAMTYTFAPNISETVAAGGTATAGATNATNSFAISLEFMLAKVGVAQGAAMTVTGGTVENMVYAVRNIAKKTFITQQFAAPSVVKSYYHTIFDATTTQSIFNADFDYSADATTNVEANVGLLTDGAGKFIYAAENTNQSIRVGQATYVAVKANFRPSDVKLAANISWDATAAVGSKLKLGNGSGAASNATFVVLKKALGAGGIAIGTYFESEAAVQKAIALDASGGSSTTYSGVQEDDYTVYTNGVSWYRINVGDNSFNPIKYGIERGKKYQIAINRITGPGVNHEDGLIVGPDTPLSEQTYISATITAKGWYTVNQGADM